MSGAHNPHTPQPTMAHYHRARSALILLHTDIVREAHSYPSAFLVALLRLSSILVQERKYTFLESPEMSDKSRYE